MNSIHNNLYFKWEGVTTMSLGIMKIMLFMGITGHAINMYCDRILSIFPNGTLNFGNIKDIGKGDMAARLMERVSDFFQNTAVMTSITNEDNLRWIGMQAGNNIKDYTLTQGAELWYKNIEIDKKMCHAYIIPITQSSDGSVIGAIMASQSADNLNNVVNRYIFICVAISLAIFVAVVIFIFLYIGVLTKVLHDVRRVLLKVSMGDLSDDRLLKTHRTDEFGELAQETEKLRVKIRLFL